VATLWAISVDALIATQYQVSEMNNSMVIVAMVMEDMEDITTIVNHIDMTIHIHTTKSLGALYVKDIIILVCTDMAMDICNLNMIFCIKNVNIRLLATDCNQM